MKVEYDIIEGICNAEQDNDLTLMMEIINNTNINYNIFDPDELYSLKELITKSANDCLFKLICLRGVNDQSPSQFLQLKFQILIRIGAKIDQTYENPKLL